MRQPGLWITTVSVLVSALACQTAEPPTEAPLPPIQDGLWLSDGYGDFAEIESGKLRTFEVTSFSCLAADELSVGAALAEGVWPLLDGDEVAGSLELQPDTTLRFQPTGTVSYRTFRGVGRRPERCDETLPETTLAAFDVLWTTFAEHYPFFELKGIDWNAVGKETRARLTEESPPEELFDELVSMIAPLEDAHVNLVSPDLERRFSGIRSDPEFPGVTSAVDVGDLAEARFARALEIIEAEYLVGEMQSFCKGHLLTGELPGGLVYIRLDQEGGYSDAPQFEVQLDVLNGALDLIFFAAAGAEAPGLVLDVRKNYGGSDVLSPALASRLAHDEYYAYAKVARSDADDPAQRTPRQERTVSASDLPSFRGPVVQLIGPYTISAGETLTQALMGREPNIVRVGQSTQGVFSDVLGRRLPNGWSFGLPNELFLTSEGESFDGPGIPPDIEIPVFCQVDLDAGRDPALERAIELLSKGARS